MYIKEEKGLTGIDIAISIIIITIFISVLTNLIMNINLNSEKTKKMEIAAAYAVQEIEQLKAKGYVDEYNNKGVDKEDIISEKDIMDKDNNFTGYSKTTTIRDYVLIKNDKSKQKNLLKELTVTVSFKLGNSTENIDISTYITD